MTDTNEMNYQIKGQVRMDEGDRILGDAAELDRLLALINTRFSRRELTNEELFIFPSVLSTQAIDAYGTRMAPSTVKRFAQDVSEGVPLMNMHRTGGAFEAPGELPIGRKFDSLVLGEFIEPGAVGFDDQRGAELLTWNYIVRGIQVSTLTNDDIIRAIESGTITDESVGFSLRPDGRMICSICGGNYLDYEACSHLAFQEYQIGEEGSEEAVRCFVWIEDANAVEGSLVYAGATPGALIRKAEEFVNTLDDEVLLQLEDLYQVRLKDPGRKIDVPAGKVPPEGPDDSPRDAGENPKKEVKRIMNVEEIRALLGEFGYTEEEIENMISDREEPSEIVENVLRDMTDQIVELEADALIGRQFRDEMIEKIIRARVQSQGEDFTEEYRGEYEETLRSGKLSFLRAELATWEKRAAEVLELDPTRALIEEDKTVPVTHPEVYR